MPITDDVARYEQLMERLMTSYKARMFAVCKAADLTPPQFFALVTIHRLKRTKMSPLAEELGLSMGAASTLVDRLVTRGLVERDADATDRRAVFVSLSAKGAEVLGEAKAARSAILRQVFEKMTPEQRQAMLDSFAALAAAWDAMGPAANPGLSCVAEE